MFTLKRPEWEILTSRSRKKRSRLSDLFNSGVLNLPLYGGALAVAFFGSGHCFGMCGGIASLAGRENMFSYHFGRGAGYLAVGAVSGGVGTALFKLLDRSPGFMIILGVLFFALFLLQAYSMWNGQLDSIPLVKAQRWFYSRFIQSSVRASSISSRGFMYGISTVFLPCGWLIYFAVIAASTGSSVSGALVFLMLFLGSLPALFAAAGAWSYFRNRFRGVGARRIMTVAVLLLSLATLSHRFMPIDGHLDSNLICGKSNSE